MGILDRLGLKRLQESLTKTRTSLVTNVGRLIASRSTVDAEFLDELEEIFISSDVGVDTTAAVLATLRQRVKEQKYVGSGELLGILKNEIVGQLGPAQVREDRPHGTAAAGPCVILVVGINGVGKTTTIGKLARKYATAGQTVVIGASDTFRAAANEQLEIWARRAGARIITQEHGSDPAAVAFDTMRSALAQKADIVIIDTAGRLHTKLNLMEELRKIRRSIEKVLPGAPHEVLLVIDASTGQNGLQQAKQFSAAVGVTGVVLTKLDGTAKGGIVLSIARELKVPVRYVGLGEGIDDLQEFDAEAFADALIGTAGMEEQ